MSQYGAAYLRSQLARFARNLLASLARILRSLSQKVLKRSVSQSTRNDLKRIEMQKEKKIVYPFDPLGALAQSPSAVSRFQGLF